MKATTVLDGRGLWVLFPRILTGEILRTFFHDSNGRGRIMS